MSSPAIFDRTLRRRRRDRAAPVYRAHNFLRALMIEGIEERLTAVTRGFSDVLDLGCFDGSFAPAAGSRIARCDPGFGFARTAGGVQADEDRLPFADASFDLVVSAGVLDQVDDLPGALALVRRVLRPDGLFLGAFLGAGSLATLRGALREAERDAPAARVHPQIDVRAAGDLLLRAGFALPVADVETIPVRYGSLAGLIDDLRGSAQTNFIADRRPLGRRAAAAAATSFARAAQDERTTERFAIVHLTGWAPDPSQPRPARRGSATASLAQVLPPRR